MEKTLITILLISIIILWFPTKLQETKYQQTIKELEEKNFQLPHAKAENNYLGIIEIKSVNIKNIIKKGTTKEILDNWYVGLLEPQEELQSKQNIILAGHNISQVFQRLHKLKINDEITLITKDQKTKYQVTKIITVEPYNTECLKTNESNMLILITCTEQDKKRLIIYAKKV